MNIIRDELVREKSADGYEFDTISVQITEAELADRAFAELIESVAENPRFQPWDECHETTPTGYNEYLSNNLKQC